MKYLLSLVLMLGLCSLANAGVVIKTAVRVGEPVVRVAKVVKVQPVRKLIKRQPVRNLLNRVQSVNVTVVVK